MRRSTCLLAVLLLAACTRPAGPAQQGAHEAAATAWAAIAQTPGPPSPSPTPAGAPLPLPTSTARPLPNGASLAQYPSLNQVQALAFAPDGALWAGIVGGVVRWDLASGVAQHFPLSDDPGGALVHDVEVLPDGTVWAATATGAGRFDGRRWVHFGAEEGLGRGVNSLAVGPDVSVWAGGEGGLARFDGARWTAVAPEPGEARLAQTPTAAPGAAPYDGLIWSVDVAPDGTVWATTHTAGILRYEPAAGRWTRYSPGPYPNARVLSIAPDGSPWVHIGYDNVYRFDGREWRVVYASGGGQWVCGIAFGVAQEPWIATCGGFHAYGSGLAHQGAGGWQTVRAAGGLPPDEITAIAVARDGTVAAGSRLGIGVLRNGTWQLLREGPTLARVTAAAVVPSGAPNGEAWFGFNDGSSRPDGGGVAHTAGERWAYSSPMPGERNPAVQLLRVSPQGELWAAVGSGLTRRTADGWRLVADGQKIQGAIHSLAFGADGSVWIGAMLGIYRLLGGELESVGGELLPTDLVIDRQGTVWITNSSLRGGGLYSYDGEAWTNRTPEAPGGKPGRPLAVTTDGALWVGADYGLARWDGQSWSRVEMASIFPSVGLLVGADQTAPDSPPRQNPVSWLASAPDGALWAAAGPSVARHAGGRWTSYDVGSGVDALAPAPNGDVWIGTERGVAILHPARSPH